MSSRRSSSSSRSAASKPTDDEINELVLKLQTLLPLLRHNSTVAEASTILEETCSYIKRLRREVDNLSERLSQLMDTADITQVEVIRKLLQD
ncbi:transcription factor PRE3 [Ziziphus jujuba]|uniref:Transcription factor PRE3 n=1 Tax=Ziziphus jujuba TaxID=326968 RepID=A0A6P3ZRB0_ZIZJJ|nr:transcription factor PRE3 [Ziziphus jujuba]